MRRLRHLVLLLAAGISAILLSGCDPEGSQAPDEASETGEVAATPEAGEEEAAVRPPLLRRQPGKQLLAHYMPWYVTPSRGGGYGFHWTGPENRHDPDKTDADGLPDIWSHYHPLIGLYDSSDPDVLDCQLLQMKLAGIDGVIVDWYGTAPVADYPANQLGSIALFEACQRTGMKFSVCFEDRTWSQYARGREATPTAQRNYLRSQMEWLQQNWFGAPEYFLSEGRPLLLNFGPIEIKDPAAWSGAMEGMEPRPRWYALHHLWKGAGADGGFGWVHWEPWNEAENPEAIKDRLKGIYNNIAADPAQCIPAAFPGFKDVYPEGQSHEVLEDRGGKTLQESLEVCMEGPWPVVQLVTWNDYGEGTVLEPCHEFGYSRLAAVLAARKREGKRQDLASDSDLELPARLLRLRREGGMDETALDRIFDDLARGKISAARSAIETLEKS